MQKSFSFSGRASNPAKKKASPAQLAARKRFAEMARSGAFKKAKRVADRDKNPVKRVVKVKKNPVVPNENFDYVMIQDIKFVAENDANLYRRQGRPIVENLAKKMAKGTFDAAKAVKLYEYLADSAVKDYSVSQLGKRTPTLTILSKPERQVLAQQLFESYADEIKDAAQEIVAKSGKKTTRTNPSKRSSRSAVVPNPAAKKPSKLSYVCIAPIEYSGSKYGIDERTPVTLKFSTREMKLAYKCYKLPAVIVQSKEFQQFANDHIVIYMSIAELKTMLRKFIK
jgi:hypothetical protein